MSTSSVTAELLEPYAQALMSLAQSQNLVDRFGEDVSFLLELLKSSDELSQLLQNPLIKADVKKGVLRQIASEQLHPLMLNFAMLLVDRGRVLFLADICKYYQSLLRQLRRAVLAEVVSATELSDAQKDAVSQRVKEITGAQSVEMETSIDPSIIGGVIIRVGSQIVDASLRGQLRRVGIRLMGSA